MCQSQLDPKEHALACNLLAHGIPLEEGELERMSEARAGLRICQSGPSFAFNVPSGAGYVFGADIWNDSKQRLSVEHISFDGLGCEYRMHLLPDPRKEHPMRRLKEVHRLKGRDGVNKYLIARQVYAFPDPILHECERGAGLNHRIGPRRFLYPGDPPLQGFLMAIGQGSIPWEYADGDRLKVRVRVFDQKGRSSAAWFHPVVERSEEEKQFLEKIASPDWVQKRADRPSRLGIRVDADLAQENTTSTSRQPEPLKDLSKNEAEISAKDVMATIG